MFKRLKHTVRYALGKSTWPELKPYWLWPKYIGNDQFKWLKIVFNVPNCRGSETLFSYWRWKRTK